jgi:hypothetical protein
MELRIEKAGELGVNRLSATRCAGGCQSARGREEPALREVAFRPSTPELMRERIAPEVLVQIRLELGPVRL